MKNILDLLHMFDKHQAVRRPSPLVRDDQTTHGRNVRYAVNRMRRGNIRAKRRAKRG